MPRLKVRPETAHVEAGARAMESDSSPLAVARANMTAHPSPALTLQARLEQSWDAGHMREMARVAKWPFGWTLIGMSVVCAAFWYLLLQLVF